MMIRYSNLLSTCDWSVESFKDVFNYSYYKTGNRYRLQILYWCDMEILKATMPVYTEPTLYKFGL
jgi:hypothetical protein